MYYILRYCEKWKQGKPQLLCMKCTPDSNPWPLSKSPRVLCIKLKIQYKQGWLYGWLLGMCTGETWVNITLPRQVWTYGFKPLWWTETNLFVIINFLILNYDRQAYTKVKIKNFIQVTIKSRMLMFFPFSSTNLVSYNELLSMRHISYQQIGCQGDSTATLYKLMFLSPPILVRGGKLMG